jgi:hypothetical protein
LGSLVPFKRVKIGSDELAECGSGSVINRGFNKSNNTISGNLLLILAETIIQNLQMVDIVFVFPERGRAV